MSVLVLGSSLRGLDSVARALVDRGEDVRLFDAEHPGAADGVGGMVTVLPATWDPAFLDGVDQVVTSPWFPETRPPIADALARIEAQGDGAVTRHARLT